MIVTFEPCLSSLRKAARRDGMVARCRMGVIDMYPKPEVLNPDTPDQRAARGAWAAGGAGWRGLSPEQKLDWKRYADTNTRYFPRRTAEPLTGYRVYQAAAGYEQMLGNGVPVEAPVQPPPAGVDRVEVLASSNSRTFRFRVTHGLKVSSGHHVLVSITPATERASRKPQRRDGRHIRGWGVDSTAPLPVSGGEVEFSAARFSVEPGERFGVWVRVVREKDGLAGQEFFVDCIRPEAESGAGEVTGVVGEVGEGNGTEELGDSAGITASGNELASLAESDAGVQSSNVSAAPEPQPRSPELQSPISARQRGDKPDWAPGTAGFSPPPGS